MRKVVGYREDWANLRRILRYAVPYKWTLLLAGVLILVGIGLDLVRPYLIKYTIDTVFPSYDMSLLQMITLVYLGTIAVSVCVLYWQSYLLQYVGQHVIYVIRQDIFTRLLTQTQAEMDKTRVGSMVTKVTNDTDAIRALFIEVLVPMAGDLLMMAGILAVMFSLHARLATVALIALLIVGISIQIFKQFSRRIYRQVRSWISASNSYVQEALNGITVVKAYGAEEDILREYEQINHAFMKTSLSEVRTFGIFRPLVDFIYFIAVVLVLLAVDFSVDIIDAALVFVFIQYTEKFFGPVRGIAERYNTLQSALAGIDRTNALWQESFGTERDDSRPDCGDTFDSLELRHVWFRYSETTDWVLRDVNLRIESGEMIGIVGESGAGKTTVMSLLMRFYIPQKGAIYLNEVPIEQYSLASTRKLLGYVFQNQHLFKGSMEDNVRLYNDTISDEEVRAALREVDLGESADDSFADGQREAGYMGSFLSMGERQLLSLARVLVRRYPVLILDEATANMDSATEMKIQRSLAKIRGKHTLLVIAHRLSTIRNANRIYVFQNGRIVQVGQYDELAKGKGYFRELLEAQQ